MWQFSLVSLIFHSWRALKAHNFNTSKFLIQNSSILIVKLYAWSFWGRIIRIGGKYDPYDMDHMIWTIWYGPYDMGHIKWAISNGPYHMAIFGKISNHKVKSTLSEIGMFDFREKFSMQNYSENQNFIWKAGNHRSEPI